MDIKSFIDNPNGQMSMQLFKLKPPTQSKQQRKEKLETYIGIVNGINSPFNLFINIENINNRDIPYVYFFSYSFGKNRVIIWGIYKKLENEIKIQSMCQFNSWYYTNYIKQWKEVGYEIYTTEFKNKFTNLIKTYVGKSKPDEIITETDYKAWSYCISYLDNKINEDDLEFLFETLDINQLSYYWENYILVGKLPIEDFYDILNISDSTDDMEFLEKIYEAKDIINEYEKKINYIDNRAPNNIRTIITQISDLFLRYVEKSQYVSESAIKLLPECPIREQCSLEDLQDENNTCAVFTYGYASFNEDDPRYMEDHSRLLFQ